MTDDLVQRLRAIYHPKNVPQEAADRIEDQSTTILEMLIDRRNATGHIEELEAALREISNLDDLNKPAVYKIIGRALNGNNQHNE